MGKRVFSREFKLEAVKLVKEYEVSKSQAARDLGIHLNVLRKRVADYEADASQAFPGLRNGV
jgi:transposase